MIQTPIILQDLRRKIYTKARTEKTWRFWGIYVHICKIETLKEGTYKSTRGWKVVIPKEKRTRELTIPTIKDLVVQKTIELLLKLIFKADFQEESYGYRPKKRTAEATVKSSVSDQNRKNTSNRCRSQSLL